MCPAFRAAPVTTSPDEVRVHGPIRVTSFQAQTMPRGVR